MFKSLKAFGAVSIFAAATGLLAISSPVQAHEPHVCPDWYPDSANMPGHIEQADVVAGAYSLAEERFDMVLGDPDFDEDGVTRELTVGDVTAAVTFQVSLGVPGRVLPANPEKRATIDRGEMLFSDIGCASCHVPEMALNSSVFSEPNPFNPAGTWADTSMSFSIDLAKQGEGPHLEGLPGQAGAMVYAYTDLKRHNLCDAEIDYFCNEQFDQGRPAHGGAPGAHFFLTRKLWGVANSAPYGHRGDLTTITDAIDVHGGEARSSRDAFQAMPIADQAAVVAFLKTLRVLPAGSPPVVFEGKEGRLAAADNMTVKGKK